MYGVSQPEHAGELSRMITSNLKSLTTISEDELRLAKHLVRGRLLRNADNSSSLAEDLGQQVLMSNRYAGPSEFASILDQVCVDVLPLLCRMSSFSGEGTCNFFWERGGSGRIVC